jgi:aryl-alcohol dehydrogenase-like predicted oxidoreductase
MFKRTAGPEKEFFVLTRQLGRTDLQVTPLCLGGNVFGWTCDEQTSIAVLDAYVSGGGNFIDTADVYSTWVPGHTGGESETIIGRWMKARGNRERVIIATKVGSRMNTGPNAQGLSRRYIMEEVEASLRRLQTDSIDLYQAHRDDPNTPLDETMAAFTDLVRQGKVRYVGASNYSTERLREALQVSDQHGYVRYESVQPPYSLVNRAAYEGDLEALCLQQGLGVITYSSLASGFLTGKYRPGKELPSSPRAKGIQERYMNEKGFQVLEQLDRIAAAHHATVSQVALAWVMARPGITAAIASGTSSQQVHELLGAVELSLTKEDMETLDRVSAWSRE